MGLLGVRLLLVTQMHKNNHWSIYPNTNAQKQPSYWSIYPGQRQVQTDLIPTSSRTVDRDRFDIDMDQRSFK